MKTILLSLVLLIILSVKAKAQITTPVIRANFGVDGELRANYYNNFVQSGNDDWFRLPGSSGTGQFIIDTTGAAAIVARYATDMASRRLPFYRNMRFPGFTVVNNRLLLDAVFIRDYHGDDSTVFAGGNKNGDNPMDWDCPISQGIPDKNDILDMMVHVRRAGPNRTDSLWMFGGLSLDNTTGNRYFDFEMYQTDIYYDRPSRQFYGYGPDAGHTSWEFDASGNITKPGDIIFSAEYQSSSLTMVEARIWVHRSALSLTPVSFDWSGQFDGGSTGSSYGYASIRPKNGGTYYTGLQCGNSTWAGPFSVVLQNESVVTEYAARQFVEFSVNLTKLGLDPVTLLGSNACGMPFRRVLVKTRSSASFTAELKDFVGPFDFFLAPRVQAQTQSPYLCGEQGTSEIRVSNPVATSVYQWATTDGNIISDSTGPVIYVNKPGTYIVTQYLQAGCSAYARDTIQISGTVHCDVLTTARITAFSGSREGRQLQLNWKVQDHEQVVRFEVQQSVDGINFITIGILNREEIRLDKRHYTFSSREAGEHASAFYRIKLLHRNQSIAYSTQLRLTGKQSKGDGHFVLYPNPVKDKLTIQALAEKSGMLKADIYDVSGCLLFSASKAVAKGVNTMVLDDLSRLHGPFCFVVLQVGNEFSRQKILISR
jgi:hypothetical protein